MTSDNTDPHLAEARSTPITPASSSENRHSSINAHPGSVARQWRDVLGRPDWLVTADQGGAVSASVAIRIPETRVLLDEHTTIIDRTSGPVSDTDLNLLREWAQR
jgi:hypothetical protein